MAELKDYSLSEMEGSTLWIRHCEHLGWTKAESHRNGRIENRKPDEAYLITRQFQV